MAVITLVHFLLSQGEKGHSPPLGPLSLAQVLTEAGFEVDFRHVIHHAGDPLSECLLQESMQDPGDILGVSTMIDALPVLLPALESIRRTHPELPLVAGGPGFGGIAQDVLVRFPFLDAVATGEGETMIVPMVEAMLYGRDLATVPGLVFRRGGTIRATAPVDLLADLDDLPMPAFDLVDLSRYGGFPVQATRGCPFHCTFCDVAPAWRRRHRKKSPQRVAQEFKEIAALGIRRLGFVDDLLTVDRKWFTALCEALVGQGNDMKWVCSSHVNLMERMDDDLFRLMADAGCTKIFAGVESGSDRILQRIDKNFRSERVLRVVGRVLKKFEFQTNLLWGFPFETPEDLIQTIRMRDTLSDMGADVGELMMVAPLANSPLYSEFYSKLSFSPGAPNIFYDSLADVIYSERHAMNQRIADNPHIFCAFHHFRYPYLADCAALVTEYAAHRKRPLCHERELVVA